MQEKPIRWGILATGTIAAKMAQTLHYLPDTQLLAVGSRREESAKAFAETHQIPRAYGSYEALAADPDLDVIYVATPHSFHYENAKLCLEHGKHVLVEKSFTTNAAQARALFELAKQKNRFLMEAFWTKFIPAYEQIRAILASGELGDIRQFHAQWGYAAKGDRLYRKLNPECAGGALLDIGIYTIGVASMLLGYQPKSIQSAVQMCEYGTDQTESLTFTYPSGAVASLTTAIGTVIDTRIGIYGSKGRITADQVSTPQSFTVTHNDGTERVYQLPIEYNGFEYQVREVCRCIRAGKTESEIMAPCHTLAVMEIMDRLRTDWGLYYPGEE